MEKYLKNLCIGVHSPNVDGCSADWLSLFICQTKGLPYDPPKFTEVYDWALPDPAAHPELLDMVVDEVIENVKNIK